MCDHAWTPSDYDPDGSPSFRMTEGKERVHAYCEHCFLRAWFTREEWYAMPEGPEPGAAQEVK